MANFVVALLPVLSNLIYILDMIYAFRQGFWEMSFIYLMITIISSSYHLCLGFYYVCFWSISKHKLADFWLAETMIPLSVVFFVRLRSLPVRIWFTGIVVVVIGVLVTGTTSSFLLQAGLVVGTLLLIGAYIVFHRVVHGYWPPYNMPRLTLGMVFTLFSIVFYKRQDMWPDGYDYLHSFWHIFGGIGHFFLMGILKQQALVSIPGSVVSPTPGVRQVKVVPLKIE